MVSDGVRTERALVLIADDDVGLAQEMVDLLSRYEFRCIHTATWATSVRAIVETPPDAIVLDQFLADVDTLQRLPELRQLTAVPILILTSNQEMTDRILGLELGADDFLSKPMSGRELVARVRAQIRGRRQSAGAGPPPKPGWTVDPLTNTLRRPDGTPVHLTTAEFTLLSRIMEKPGENFGRDDLTRAVFGRAWRAGDRAVDSIVVNLRMKLDRSTGAPDADQGSCILTVRNAGYRFVKLPEEA